MQSPTTIMIDWEWISDLKLVELTQEVIAKRDKQLEEMDQEEYLELDHICEMGSNVLATIA